MYSSVQLLEFPYTDDWQARKNLDNCVRNIVKVLTTYKTNNWNLAILIFRKSVKKCISVMKKTIILSISDKLPEAGDKKKLRN